MTKSFCAIIQIILIKKHKIKLSKISSVSIFLVCGANFMSTAVLPLLRNSVKIIDF